MFMRREQAAPAELAIPFSQKQYNSDIATTTFGPLDKYVAANDNEPVGNVMNSPLNGGHIGTAVPHGYTTDTAGNIRPLSSDNVPRTNDKLRRLLKSQLTDDEKVELDEAMFAAPIKTAIAKEWNGDGPREWVEGHLIPDCSNPASRGVFVPAEPPRVGSFMQTFTGRKYWPMSPRPHEVYIEDIAHSLGLQCRYAGHCIKFYSVAEHSVLIARYLAAKHAPEVALAGLLHDAPEAYCVDIPRPLKPYLTNYKEIEQKNWLAIAARFGLSPELPREVHDADNRIIADELVNLVPMPWHARHNNPLGVKLRYWSPEKAEIEFLATFEALMAGRV